MLQVGRAHLLSTQARPYLVPCARAVEAGMIATATAMQPAELWRLSARALAEKIRGGEGSAVQAVGGHIAPLEAVNPRLNAGGVQRYDEARAAAKRADPTHASRAPPRPPRRVPPTRT